jgi:hypothetical protein
MSDSLFDILAHKDFDQPAEIAAIKQYINDHFQESIEVIVRERDIIVTTPSAALASTLRFHVRQMQQAAQTTKRIILHIR